MTTWDVQPCNRSLDDVGEATPCPVPAALASTPFEPPSIKYFALVHHSSPCMSPDISSIMISNLCMIFFGMGTTGAVR
jgi:hypothetical protein